MFCKHNYVYTQGHFYCTKCHARTYKEEYGKRKSKKAPSLLTFLGFLLIGATVYIQSTMDFESLILVIYGLIASSIIVFVIALHVVMKPNISRKSQINFSQYDSEYDKSKINSKESFAPRYAEDPAKIPDADGNLFIPEEAGPSGKINEELQSDKKSSSKNFNESFTTKNFDFNEGLESVIEVNYKAPKETRVKLFFSTNDWETFSRNYNEQIEDNFIRLTISVASKTTSSLISGGNYDFNDDFDRGYTLLISMKYEDPELLSLISNVLRGKKFGCLPTKHTIHAHKNDKEPMEHKAVKLLSEITKDVYTAISEMKL